MKRGGPSLRSCPPRLRRTSGTRDHVLVVTGVVMWNWPFGGGGMLAGAITTPWL